MSLERNTFLPKMEEALNCSYEIHLLPVQPGNLCYLYSQGYCGLARNLNERDCFARSNLGEQRKWDPSCRCSTAILKIASQVNGELCCHLWHPRAVVFENGSVFQVQADFFLFTRLFPEYQIIKALYLFKHRE